jgi:hypothetical protein
LPSTMSALRWTRLESLPWQAQFWETSLGLSLLIPIEALSISL